MIRTIAVMVGVSFLAQAGFGAVYKCTGENGSVSYQDQPCGGDEHEQRMPSERTVSVDGTDLEMVQVVVPGVGMAFVGLFDHMEHMTRRHGQLASTIAVRSKKGHPPMEMQITFFANERGDSYTHRLIAQKLASLSPVLEQPPMPFGSEHWRFETAIGDASMISHYSPGGGHFHGSWDTLTIGYVAHPKVVAAVTILNNGKTSDSLRWALKVYNMFQVAVGDELLQ